MDITVLDGIIIGGVGGAIAGASIWLINLLKEIIIKKYHKDQIYKWLYKATKQENIPEWKDDPLLLRFLRHDCDIDWAEDAEIDITHGGQIIQIPKDENSAKIILANDEKKAALKVGDRTIYNLKIKKENGKRNIYKEQWRSTRTIASYCNVTQDRVRHICSFDKRIVLSTGGKRGDLWGIKKITRPDSDEQKSPIYIFYHAIRKVYNRRKFIMQYAKYTIEGKNIRSISDVFKKELTPSVEYASKGDNTYFFVFERYSFAQNSDMSGILLIDIENENRCIVNAVVAGGKVGPLRLDIFGRENSVLNNIKKVLQKISDENNWKLQ